MREIASVYTARTKRRILIGCLSALIGIPLVGCCLILIVTTLLPMLDNLSASGNQNTGMYVMLGIGLFVFVGMIAIALAVFAVMTLRRARALDAVFTPMGLKGSAYMLNGRHYQGQIGGRAVDIYIYRGPTVEFRLQAATQTRLLAVPKGSLPTSVAWIFDKHPLATGTPVLSAFSIFPLDENWSRKLLAESGAAEAIRTLMSLGADWAIFRRVEIQPGEVTLTLYRSRSVFGNSIEQTAAQAWMNALQALAQAAESQPAPEVTAQKENTSSREVRKKRSNSLVYIVIALVFGMPVCFIAVGVIAYLAVTLLR
jgi:hypothetical protein